MKETLLAAKKNGAPEKFQILRASALSGQTKPRPYFFGWGKTLKRLIVVFVCCLGLVAAGSSEASDSSVGSRIPSTTTGPFTSIRIVIPVNSIFASLTMLAIDGGFLKANGMDAELVISGSGALAVAAVVAGSAQVYGSDPGSVFAVQSKVKMVMPLRVYSGAGLSLTISKEVADKTGFTQSSPVAERVNALNGMTIAAVGVASPTAMIPRDAAKRAGITIKETYMQTPAAVVAMQQGKIDGLVASSPFGERATADGSGVIWINGPKGEWEGRYGLGYIQQSMGFTEDFVSKSPNLTLRIIRAYLDAADMVSKEPEKAGAILRKRFSTMEDNIWASIWPAQAKNVSEPFADLAAMQTVYKDYADGVTASGGKPTEIDLQKMLISDMIARAKALPACQISGQTVTC